MRIQKWTLNKLITLALLGGYVVLPLEIRYSHRHVLAEHPISWTPLIFSGLMLLGGLIALTRWDRGGRQGLLVGFVLSARGSDGLLVPHQRQSHGGFATGTDDLDRTGVSRG